jgi:hypothetical protein
MKYRRTPFLVLLLGILLGGLATEASAACEGDKSPPTCSWSLAPGGNVITVVISDPNNVCAVLLKDAHNLNPSGLGPVNPPKPFTIVSAYKSDNTERAWIVLRVRDCCLNETTCDPVLTSVVRAEGKPVVDTYSEIPQAEGFITIVNGTPGLRRIVAIVNGERFSRQGLKDGEEVTLDVTAAMEEGSQNTISLAGYGKPGGNAAVMIWDGLTQ